MTTLLGLAAAMGWAAVQPRTYTAHSTGQVTTGNNDNLGLALAADQLARSKATQFKALATSPAVAKAAVSKAGIDLSPDAALGRVSVSVPLDTAQLEISAKGSTPDEARKLADAWVAALGDEAQKIENGGSKPKASSSSSPEGQSSVIRVVSISQAALPGAPSSPNLKVALAIGLLAGLLAGFIYALVKSYFDRRIRSAAIFTSEFDIPVVGTIPASKVVADGKRISGRGDTSVDTADFRVTEAFKELRTNVQFMNPDNPPRIFTVTSALPGDGKSTVADNIALSIAEQGRPVFLVDADLRRPTVARTFKIIEIAGLTDVIVGKARLDDVLQEIPSHPSLQILGAGPIPPNPSEIIASDRFSAIIYELAERGTVIIDAPPLLPVTDAAILAARFDGALIVAQAGQTTIDALQTAIDNLRRVNARILGAVLNRVPTSKGEASRYNYYGHQYDYSADIKSNKRKGKRAAASSRLTRNNSSNEA
ncbi:polysaccharide biosynthesis tyrosine autokinase [Falsarthrobacter nasiphocae]|uniref:polysaccharide biosynthesis tyrosine autokinase n=1 Tax=Falsarthrobacter nasiphocae TaxID=189863 RepID=UPI00286BF5FF|nr:polysaccharide biosynthesis tyrosine autokinase [Falsarthrobacter nasiphocae]